MALFHASTCNRDGWLGATCNRGGTEGRIGFTTAVDDGTVSAATLAIGWRAMTKTCGCGVRVVSFFAGALVSSSFVKSITDLLAMASVTAEVDEPATAIAARGCNV